MWREGTYDDEILQSKKKSSFMTSTWRYVCDGINFENYYWLIYLRKYHSSYIHIQVYTFLRTFTLYFATLKLFRMRSSILHLILSRAFVCYILSNDKEISDCLYYYSTCIAMDSNKRLHLKTKSCLKKFQIK